MLFGGAGNDMLIAGSAGNYTMQGGAGIDTAVFAGNQSDYTIDGGTPIGWPSWLRVIDNATGAVSWLQTVEQLQFADGTIDAPLPLNALGTAGADVINAVAGGEVIYGLAGDDRLTGGSGEDVLDGGAGADRMSGGAGNDCFFIDNSDTLVDGGEGYDSVYVDDSQGAPGLGAFRARRHQCGVRLRRRGQRRLRCLRRERHGRALGPMGRRCAHRRLRRRYPARR